MDKELVFLFEKTSKSADELSPSIILKSGESIRLQDIPSITDEIDFRTDLAEIFSYGDARLKAEIFAGFSNDDYSCIRVFSSISRNYGWRLRMTPRVLENKEFDVMYKNKLKRKFVKLKNDTINTDLNPFYKVIDTY